jgi:hypothetical protein
MKSESVFYVHDKFEIIVSCRMLILPVTNDIWLRDRKQMR